MDDAWQPLQNVSKKYFSLTSLKLTRPLFCFVLMYILQRKNKTTHHKRFKLDHEACGKKKFNDEAGI